MKNEKIITESFEGLSFGILKLKDMKEIFSKNIGTNPVDHNANGFYSKMKEILDVIIKNQQRHTHNLYNAIKKRGRDENKNNPLPKYYG